MTLTATVAPKAAGTVRFVAGGTTLGTATVTDGAATFRTAPLAVGSHALSATFVPTDATAYRGSTSAPVTVAVTATPVTPAPTTAGSLTWGVKESFRSYIVGPVAKGGATATSGASVVDGVFRFGQADGGTWTAASGRGRPGTPGRSASPATRARSTSPCRTRWSRPPAPARVACSRTRAPQGWTARRSTAGRRRRDARARHADDGRGRGRDVPGRGRDAHGGRLARVRRLLPGRDRARPRDVHDRREGDRARGRRHHRRPGRRLDGRVGGPGEGDVSRCRRHGRATR